MQQWIQRDLRGFKTLQAMEGVLDPLVSMANITVTDNIYAYIGTSVNVKTEVLAAG